MDAVESVDFDWDGMVVTRDPNCLDSNFPLRVLLFKDFGIT